MIYLDWHNLFEQRLAADIGPIAGFGYGTPSEAIAAPDKVYPMLWLESTPYATQPAAQQGGTAPNVLEWRSAFYILDIGLEGTQSYDQSGRVQVINRCWAIAEACLAYLYKFSEDLNVTLGSISITPIIDEFADRSTGVRVELTLMLQSDWNGCALPLAGFTPGPDPGGGGGATFCDLVLVCTAPLQAQITANAAAIQALQLAVSTLQTQVGDLTASVALLGIDVSALNDAVAALGLQVATNTANIAALQARGIPWLKYFTALGRWAEATSTQTWGAGSAANNTLILYPVLLGTREGTYAQITRLGFYFEGGTAVSLRYGLYPDPNPGTTPLFDSGLVPLTLAGLYETIIALPFAQNDLLYIGIIYSIASSGVSLSAVPSTSPRELYEGPTTASGRYPIYRTVAAGGQLVTNPLPAVPAAIAQAVGGAMPIPYYLLA